VAAASLYRYENLTPTMTPTVTVICSVHALQKPCSVCIQHKRICWKFIQDQQFIVQSWRKKTDNTEVL